MSERRRLIQGTVELFGPVGSLTEPEEATAASIETLRRRLDDSVMKLYELDDNDRAVLES